MKIIDAHTHVDYITPEFQSGVDGCICCTTIEAEWNKLVEIMNNDNRVYGAFGVHPWFVDTSKSDFDVRLKNLLERNSNYMIGEIGLDKYKPNMEKQIDFFIKQFNLAVQLKRPMFLHCVGAWDKILHIFKQYKDLPIIVLHAFNGNENVLNNLLKYQKMYFSFDKNAVYDRNQRIHQIPLNKILIESDGKKDVNLIKIIDEISKIKNESNMVDIIYDNTQRILKNG